MAEVQKIEVKGDSTKAQVAQATSVQNLKTKGEVISSKPKDPNKLPGSTS